MIFEGFVDASRDGGVNQRNVTHLSTTGLCDASSHEHAIAIVTMIANTMHDSTASVSTKRCIPAQTDVEERIKLARDHWGTAPIQGGQRHCFYIFEALEEVKEGTIVTIRARIAKGQVTVFAGTQSNVRQQFRCTSRLVNYYGSRSGYFQFTASASSKVYIGVQLDRPDAIFQVKYTTGIFLR